MKRASLVISLFLLIPAALLAQTPSASGSAGGLKVAVVDFNRAVTESAEGKKGVQQLQKEMADLQTEFEGLQKSLEDMETRLRTGDKALSDVAKADLTRKIDATTTELNRKNEDAQKKVQERQSVLFGPVAQRAQGVLQAYAQEMGFAVVFDVSSQASNIIYFQDVADITTELIRRIDADVAKAPARPPAAAPAPKP